MKRKSAALADMHFLERPKITCSNRPPLRKNSRSIVGGEHYPELYPDPTVAFQGQGTTLSSLPQAGTLLTFSLRTTGSLA